MRPLNIARPDSRSQTIGAVVGLTHKLFRIAERNCGNDGAENLLLNDLHLLARVHEHCWLNKISLGAKPLATNNRLRSFGESGVEVTANAVELRLRNQGAHVGRGVPTRADVDFLSLFGNALDHLVKDTVLDVKPRSRATALPMVKEDRTRGAGDRAVQVDI